MEDLVKAAEALVKFIEDEDISDEAANDGGGHTDMWRSGEFDNLINKVKTAIAKSQKQPQQL